MQTEQIMAWMKAYNMQRQKHQTIGHIKNEQLNALTSQLFLLESRLRRKQRHIANILIESECTILRQQKIIDTLSSRLVDYKLDLVDGSSRISATTDLETLNDSDSAVVLEDIDSDSNTSASIILRRRHLHSASSCYSGDVTIMRSISDAIETSLNKYTCNNGNGGGGGSSSSNNNNRRSNCYLRRPDILETVYSVEEDAEPDAAEKRDNFKKQAKSGFKCSNEDTIQIDVNALRQSSTEPNTPTDRKNGTVNYNRVMSNHRSVTKPKDVKYKRINKAKSKSLEELRGRLKHWVDKGNIELVEAQKAAQSYVWHSAELDMHRASVWKKNNEPSINPCISLSQEVMMKICC